MREVMLGRPIRHHSPKRLGRKKAKTILSHGEVRGHPLTAKQEAFMEAVAHGFKPTGKTPRGDR